MIFNILAGFLSGLTASMGLGGGFVLMIFLTVFKTYNQIYSQAINLMFFIPIAIFSSIFHIKNKLVEVKPLIFFIIFGTIGVVFGFLMIYILPINILRKLFSLLLLFYGIKELFHKK